MWLKFSVLALCAISFARSVKVSPPKDVFSVAEGSRLQINCSSPNGVEWSSDPAVAMTQTSQSRVEGSVAGSDNISTLTFSSVQKSNEGKYVCRDTTSTKANVTFQLRVFSVTKQDATFEYNEDAVLNCRVNDNRNFSYKWKRGDQWVTELSKDGKQKFMPQENGSLVIQDAPRNLAGVFTCVAEYEEDNKKHTIEIPVNYFAQPKVIRFGKSKNLVQEERLVVECKVLGFPEPTISWFKEDQPIETGEGSRFKLSVADTYNDGNIENGKLVIDSVNFDDAAEYMCMATNSKWPEFNSTEKILVRVKDKLAALWPFLGIVAEVVVLCAIIFFYEKKCNKDTAVEEETNQDGFHVKVRK